MREGGAETATGLRKAMHDIMESGAGIYRSRESLEQTCGTLAQLRRRYGQLQLADRSNVFNTDLLQALELGSMLEVAEALAQSALQRRESRGSHQRLDHPKREDDTYLKHSLATYRGADPPAITYRDVVITRSQPAERIYGGQAA
jgi:fumarate reductase flavoprotein subunit